MRLLRILITKEDNYETVVKFDEPLFINNETMTVKCANVFWDFDNITSPIFITNGTEKLWFKKGYWTAAMIIDKLNDVNASAELVHHSRKIKITPKENMDLLELAPLLGFSKTWKNIPKYVSHTGNTAVNVNLGMKYVRIKCSAVNKNKTSFSGKHDDTIAIIPITTKQSLKGSVTYYKNINSETELDNGIYTELKFSSDQKVGDILLEIMIK